MYKFPLSSPTSQSSINAKLFVTQTFSGYNALLQSKHFRVPTANVFRLQCPSSVKTFSCTNSKRFPGYNALLQSKRLRVPTANVFRLQCPSSVKTFSCTNSKRFPATMPFFSQNIFVYQQQTFSGYNALLQSKRFRVPTANVFRQQCPSSVKTFSCTNSFVRLLDCPVGEEGGSL